MATLDRLTRVALSSGDKLSSDEMVAPLGASGLGEVYRDNDAKLNRDVRHPNAAQRIGEFRPPPRPQIFERLAGRQFHGDAIHAIDRADVVGRTEASLASWAKRTCAQCP